MIALLVALALLASDGGAKTYVPLPAPKLLVEQGGQGCDAFLRDARPLMGTWVELQLCGPAGRDLKADADAAFAEFARLDALLSTWKSSSEVSAINREAGKTAVKVSADTFEVLERAQGFSRRSNGLFDVTFAALKLWHFDEDLEAKVPTPEQIAARLKLVGYQHLVLDPKGRTARLDISESQINLGGIGKGFAVDKAVALLRARGLKDFVVKAGGDLYCAGRRGKRPWRVGVRDPRDDGGGFFAVMEVQDAAFSTSGDYERFFVVGGKRFHHIIDPRTGYPATLSRSATVLAKSATEAEGLTKPMFILGPDAGAKLALDQGAQGVLVGADNRVVVTPGLRKLRILHPPTAGEGP